MKRIHNIYLMSVVLLLLMASFTYLVEDVSSFILYFVIATGSAVFLKLSKYLILSAFLIYMLFAIVAQIMGLDWFYHDMPDRIGGFYLLMSSVRAFLLIVPICCGIGLSWLIDRRNAAH